MRITTAILTVLMTGTAFGQDQPASGQFVAADIHASAKDALDFGNNLGAGESRHDSRRNHDAFDRAGLWRAGDPRGGRSEVARRG